MLRHRIACVLIAGFVFACGESDKQAPPPPTLDPAASPTGAERVVITGTAEFGAKIKMTGAASFEPAETTADQYTSRFTVVAVLNKNATNTLQFTATDRAGNTSGATTLTIVHEGVSAAAQNVRVNGVGCPLTATPPVCVVVPGDAIDFDLVSNERGLAEVDYSAYFRTTDTLFTRRVVIPSDATFPISLHFNFNVPFAAQPEDLPLAVVATDHSGNRFNSTQLILRVNPYVTGGRMVVAATMGKVVNNPNDVAVDPDGNLYISNGASNRLLRVAAGTTSAYVYSPYDRYGNYLVRDTAGNIYLSEAGERISRIDAAGSAVSYWLDLNLTGNNATGMVVSPISPSRAEETLFVASQTNASIYRFPLTVIPTGSTADQIGTFNVGFGQWGLAVKDVSASATADLYFYFGENTFRNRLYAFHAVGAGAPTPIFMVTAAGGTNFVQLYDIAVRPSNGCLLVSDEGNGRIYSVDARDVTNTTPTVAVVASGMSLPRGLAFHNDELYVALAGSDAIIKISPSGNAGDCF